MHDSQWGIIRETGLHHILYGMNRLLSCELDVDEHENSVAAGIWHGSFLVGSSVRKHTCAALLT